MADLLTTFIWQVSIVHSLDHEIYVNMMSRNFPWSLAINGLHSTLKNNDSLVPFEPYSNTKFWDDFCEERGLKLADIMEDPARKLITSVDLIK